MGHAEYIKEPYREFWSAMGYAFPRKWLKAREGVKAIFWFVMLPCIILIGFPAAMILGYLSGVLNREGVSTRRKRIANEHHIAYVQRMGRNASTDITNHEE